jgi:hypothetical protein
MKDVKTQHRQSMQQLASDEISHATRWSWKLNATIEQAFLSPTNT